jgi:hypothetical protein
MIPLVTALEMYSKWRVSPLMSTPQQIMASTVPDMARSLAAYGSSYAPGTSLMNMFSSVTLHPLTPAYFHVDTFARATARGGEGGRGEGDGMGQMAS